jgi:hypothetical protein
LAQELDDMPVTLELIEHERCFRYVISDPWKIADFVATFPHAKTILDASPFPVHGIVNLHATAKDPMGVLTIRKHPSFSHPNSGYTAFCHATLLARRVTETALKIARFNRLKFFDSEQEGMTFLRELMAQEDLARQNA